MFKLNARLAVLTYTEKGTEAKFMKGLFKKSNFEYTSGNDEIQNRTHDSLFIHYD